MLRSVTVLRTKITPPRPGPRTLERPRVTCLLAEALNYRLTVVQAGAGFGKTTALAGLAGLGRPLIWYQVMPEDRAPLVFLLHLCHASRLALPERSDLPADGSPVAGADRRPVRHRSGHADGRFGRV